jgi:DinB family protein
MNQDLRYPVGRFNWEGPEPSSAERGKMIAELEAAPARMRAAVAGLTKKQLDTPYRPEGWTVRQLTHHVPESHMNAYIRFKLALTEDVPTIKPYMEDRWAKLADVPTTPIENSLELLTSLHQRWVRLLQSMSDADFARTYFHPEKGAALTLGKTLALYAWHGKHHAAHVTALRERMGWKAKAGRSVAKKRPKQSRAKARKR